MGNAGEAAQPDDAVEITSLRLALDLVSDFPELSRTSFAGVPVRQDILLKVVEIIRNAIGIEDDVRIGRVYDRLGVDAVGTGWQGFLLECVWSDSGV